MRWPGRCPNRKLGRLVFLGGVVAGLAAGWLLLPDLLYSRHPQPLDFSHPTHVQDAGMDCEECHAFRPDGSFAGIPPLAVCEDCHTEPLGDSEAERVLVDRYIGSGRDIPWRVYARQPQNVYFSHIHHVKLAEISCARCHGDHASTASLPPVMINRISTYSRDIWGPRISGGGPEPGDSMKMSDCSGCHAESGVQDHCLMCHK
jgi:hypothetical protein